MSITVVIPAYNGARFISKALLSALNQTRPPDEIIVIDDGSTDDTASIVRQYPVRLIQQANAGVSAARNRAIGEATSDWVAFLDQDDWFDSGKLASHEAVSVEGVVLSYSRIRDAAGKYDYILQPGALAKLLTVQNVLVPGAVMVRRSALLELGGFNVAINGCEDWELWLRLAKKGRFAAAEGAILNCLEHGDNYSLRPTEMLRAVHIALPTLLSGIGYPEIIVRRRQIMAIQYASAGLMCRGHDERKALRYFMRSIGAWPSPFFRMSRYKLLAVQCVRLIRS